MYFILGKSDCPYCDKARALLDSTNTKYVYKNLDKLPEVKKKLWVEVIKTELNKTTVPVIIDIIGGYDELKELLNG